MNPRFFRSIANINSGNIKSGRHPSKSIIYFSFLFKNQLKTLRSRNTLNLYLFFT